ncbi:alpha/beta hydrolase [Alteraurantiacibacter aestuarii]|uniref:Alpha/beta fold hydrolase n=1 Tax=Alteraurantiacibacter aestuarii TaxID=650004 RepID=A0A844ZLI7_9SPHN|nr:alpha/beta fold hydrolase [Alteraurantiacibacter aestuarii]MXO87976.1 alpha/beta fold hydrolase [Alteraurantiacibacter aestuarii]
MGAAKLKHFPVAQGLSERAGMLAHAVSRRVELLRQQPPHNAAHPSRVLMLGESTAFVEPVLRHLRAPLQVPVASQRKIVILLPGFATHPLRMRYMARQLEAAGHVVKRWGMGFNFGPTEENFEILSRRVCDVHDRYGQKVVLVGWSLGGIFAREIAKRHPQHVAKVVTMGAPFSHTPYSNNVWRIYQLITGHSVESPPVAANIAAKPPVETVAFWSPRDGVVAARSACGCAGERDRTRALRCTHMGFSNSAEAILAVAEELDAA